MTDIDGDFEADPRGEDKLGGEAMKIELIEVEDAGGGRVFKGLNVDRRHGKTMFGGGGRKGYRMAE